MNDNQTLRPETADQLTDTIQWLISERMSATVKGLGSKSLIGSPKRPETVLDLSAFSGIELYEPEELVLSAGPATPMAEINKQLDEKRQMLAFEPPNYARLLGLPEDQSGSLGGLIATNLSGPRRIKAGAARDHFLGFQAVSGRGERFKSGGRVVKNVTGYDLSKLICGSWGTLAALYQVTVKTLPRPEKSRTVIVQNVDADTARDIMSRALNTPYEVSGACWLPETAVSRSQVSILEFVKGGIVAIRVEGPGPSVAYRCQAMRDMFKSHGRIEELHTKNTNIFWKEVRDVHPFCGEGDDRVVWKISVPPTIGPEVIRDLSNIKGAEAFMDWGGGLIWLALDVPKLGAGDLVRNAANKQGGHAMLVRASSDLRLAIPTFHPQNNALSQLEKRLKQNFDPHGILNPGLMFPENGEN